MKPIANAMRSEAMVTSMATSEHRWVGEIGIFKRCVKLLFTLKDFGP